jgi:hypothetical protein
MRINTAQASRRAAGASGGLGPRGGHVTAGMPVWRAIGAQDAARDVKRHGYICSEDGQSLQACSDCPRRPCPVYSTTRSSLALCSTHPPNLHDCTRPADCAEHGADQHVPSPRASAKLGKGSSSQDRGIAQTRPRPLDWNSVGPGWLLVASMGWLSDTRGLDSAETGPKRP